MVLFHLVCAWLLASSVATVVAQHDDVSTSPAISSHVTSPTHGKRPLPSTLGEKVKRATERAQDYGSDSYQIVKYALKERDVVAALSASSPWLVDTILEPLCKSTLAGDKGRRILEIGFGPGTVTREVVDWQLDPEDRFDAVEINAHWHKRVAERYPAAEYTNVHLHCAPFQNWKCPIGKKEKGVYDFIICTIPFTRLPREVMDGCLQHILKLLKPGGSFTYITLIGARTLGNLSSKCAAGIHRNPQEHQERAERLAAFDQWTVKHFDQKKRVTVWLNFTPVFVHHLIKRDK